MKSISDIITEYQIKVKSYQKQYIDFPQVISFETFSKCNASCIFCPYQNLKRKGTKLSDGLINKIILNLKDIPKELPIRIVPVRVNEPFLDKRIIGICHSINEKLKNAHIEFYSNGSTLSKSLFKNLLKLKKVSVLGISLNYYDKISYEKTMKLSYEKTLANLDEIHTEYNRLQIPFYIAITSVSNGDEYDKHFLSWVHKRWPKFSIHILPKNDWLNDVIQYDCDPVPNISCNQWFSVNILSDGNEAFCCIDAEGKYGTGNINKQHILDIYNNPRKRILRELLPSRKDVPICKDCSFLSSKIIKKGIF